MERGKDTPARRTLGFGDRVRADVRNLPSGDPMQGSAYGRANSLITDASQSRQRLLFFTEPRIPAALWVVIYVGAFLVFHVGVGTVLALALALLILNGIGAYGVSSSSAAWTAGG